MKKAKRFIEKISWVFLPSAVIIILLLMGRDIWIAAATKTLAKYFSAPLASYISMIITLLIAYYLSARNSNINKRKDIVYKHLESVVHDMADPRAYKIYSEPDLDYVRVMQRSTRRRLHIVNEFSDNFINKKELEYIMKLRDDYWDCISDNFSNLDALKGMENKLYDLVEKICNGCESIEADLYR